MTEFTQWSATTGMELEREIEAWQRKSAEQQAEIDRLRAERAELFEHERHLAQQLDQVAQTTLTPTTWKPMTNEELAQHLYSEWARQKDFADPIYDGDGELPRMKPRPHWAALESAEQTTWLNVASVAARLFRA